MECSLAGKGVHVKRVTSWWAHVEREMEGVGPRGLEPRTSSLSGKRSNRAELWAPEPELQVRSSMTTAVRITLRISSGEAENGQRSRTMVDETPSSSTTWYPSDS